MASVTFYKKSPDCTRFVELGRYLQKLQKDEMIHLVSDNFFIYAPVYVFLAELRSLLRLEVAVNDYFPFTLYL